MLKIVSRSMSASRTFDAFIANLIFALNKQRPSVLLLAIAEAGLSYCSTISKASGTILHAD
jgi:hypothetical protein